MGNLTFSSECPSQVTCEANFTEIHETSGIKVSWFLNGKDINEENPKSAEDYSGFAAYYLVLPCNISNFGNLTCRVSIEKEGVVVSKTEKTIKIALPLVPTINVTDSVTVNSSDTAFLHCEAVGYPAPNISWTLRGDAIESKANKFDITRSTGSTSSSSTIKLTNAGDSDNGTYVCHATNNAGDDSKPVALKVQTKPKVTIAFALGVGKDSIYLNWTLNNGNLPIDKYIVKYLKEDEESWQYSSVAPNVSATSLVIGNLETNTSYRFQIEAENAMGRSYPDAYKDAVRTLSTNPEYTPVVDIKGSTFNSFTIGWGAPPEEIRHLIGHYMASYKSKEGLQEKVDRVSAVDSAITHLFTNLKPATVYSFKVKACQRYTGRCGNFSNTVEGKTLDGKPSPPQNVKMRCDRNANRYFATVTWEAPAHPNGQLKHFTV